MKKFKVLTLTDHSKHHPENSIYPILNEMTLHDEIEKIDVLSRGLDLNKEFFENPFSSEAYGKTVDSSFEYSVEGIFYQDNNRMLDLSEYDLLFMRLPRPIKDEYLIDLKKRFENILIINDPLGILKTSSKRFLLNFEKYCPKIKYCSSIEEILNFSKEIETVLKPLKDYGGKGILRIAGNSLEANSKTYDTWTYLKSIEDEIKSEGYVAMEFLKNVSEGDKRIVVVGGQIIGASLRLPKKGSWLCNVSQGGNSQPADIDIEEMEIITNIHPKLIQEGIFIYGVDTLVNNEGKRVLSEINTMSIGGFHELKELNGKEIFPTTIELIIKYAREYYLER